MNCLKCKANMGNVPQWKKLCITCWKSEKFGTKNEYDLGAESEARFLNAMEQDIVLAETNYEQDSDFRKKYGLYRE